MEVFPSVELDLPVEEPDRDVVEMSGGSTDDREVLSREEGEDVRLEFVGDGEEGHGWNEEEGGRERRRKAEATSAPCFLDKEGEGMR